MSRTMYRWIVRMSQANVRRHIHAPWAILLALSAAPRMSWAQSDAEQAPAFTSARAAVHEGNKLLRAGKAQEALQAYELAKSLEPGALEIPFVQGLSQFQLHDLEAARDSWSRAALTEDASLADAATYSLGTTYHAEALKEGVEPEKSTKLLEQAMERYQQVLSHDAAHVAARDSLRKAAALRRQIKEMMQQQQEQQSNQEKSDEEKKEQQDEQEKQQSDQSEKSENDEQESEQSQDQQDQQNQESSQQHDQEKQESEEKQDQDSQSESSPEEQQEQNVPKEGEKPPDPSDAEEKEGESKESPAQPQEDLSRDQAERQLREMMQSMRDRQKQRKQTTQRPPIKPADKDW